MSDWSQWVEQASKEPKRYTYMKYETFMTKLEKEMARASEIYLGLCIGTAIFVAICLYLFWR